LATVAIDPLKLPAVCVLDTGVLLLALNQRVNRPDSAVCRALWKALLATNRLRDGARVLIPAPAIAELVRGTTHQEPPKVPGVFIAPFTARTARFLGQHLSTTLIEAVVAADRVPRAYVKYDSLIAATAIAADATLIALDGWFHRASGAWPIAVKNPNDFVRDQLDLDIEA